MASSMRAQRDSSSVVSGNVIEKRSHMTYKLLESTKLGDNCLAAM